MKYDNIYPNLPYHNAKHAAIVRDRALAIAGKLQQVADVELNLDIIQEAAELHDACFGDEKAKDYQSQEHYTAEVAGDLLKEQNCDENFITTVQSSIIATNPWQEPQTIEEKILRAADMGGLMNYDTYREDFEKLMAEANTTNEREFLLNSISFLSLYIWPTIHLTPGYYNERGASEWHSNTLSNIIQHYKELFDEPVIVEVGSGANPCVLFENMEGLVIGIEPDYMARKDSITLLWGNKKTEIITPGDGSRMPIEEEIDCLRYYNVVLRHTEALNEDEINRVGPTQIEVVESYSPTLGHKDQKSAKKGIQNRLEGYNLSKDKSAYELPNADSEAYRLTFEIGHGIR
jgi:hypothetical protein